MVEIDTSDANTVFVRTPWGYIEIGGFSRGKRERLAEQIKTVLENYEPKSWD